MRNTTGTSSASDALLKFLVPTHKPLPSSVFTFLSLGAPFARST